MTWPGIADPAPWPRDRRVERSRRTIELAIDTVIRPGSWAAKIAYELGLQGRVRSRTHRFDLGRLRRDAVRPTLRVAFAADFHAGATTDERLLSDACRAIAAFTPDLVLLGGDFVSVRASYIERLSPLLAAIRAPLGKLAVLGNHDLRADRATVLRGLRDAGVRVLDNGNKFDTATKTLKIHRAPVAKIDPSVPARLRPGNEPTIWRRSLR